MNGPSIAILDYQAGNLRSVQKALQRYGALAKITSNPVDIESADGLVFPGQGACDSSMRELKSRGLVEPIKSFIAADKPYLGVCLGLQLLLENSEEGSEDCLGVVSGRTKKLPSDSKVPHIGWNQVEFSGVHPVLDGIQNGSHFYFVHSYYADPTDDVVVGTTNYGIKFCSVIAWSNAVAVQFHPEKSGMIGLKLYSNFVDFVNQLRHK